ncbi:hypothetical protein CKA38_10260 [Ereboglobus luteus]|uniref:HTH araC/xylS-type domain-containing protein n=2 Tax=Ereboglobus luteus TaxID=1796921 RepID=A0A2U8E4U8_9BACT|nr:hypothetical protein CKA38_10260 [Ereboglobus luteus]
MFGFVRFEISLINKNADMLFRELSDFRATIEGFGARHAAKRVGENPALMGNLNEILKRLADAARRGNYPAFREADKRLHQAIMETSGIPGLADAWRIIWEKLAAFHQRQFYEGVPDLRTHIGEHTYLVEAIGMRDPAAAEDAARSHIEASWVRMAATRGTGAASNALHLASAYMSSHLQYQLRLDDVAARVAFTSPGNLSRLFRQQHGMGFQAYLQRLRMAKAAELLASTNLPVTTITRRVGYRSPSLFAQHFFRHYSQRPREWRKEKKTGLRAD